MHLKRPFIAEGPLTRIVQMGAAFAASDLLRGGIRLLTSLVIARGLGLDAFGRWTLYAAWASALTAAFDLGFGVLLTREAARGDRRVVPLVSRATAVRLVLFAPVAVFVTAVHPFSNVGDVRRIAPIVLAVAAAGLAYGCIAAVFRAGPRRLVVILSIELAGAIVLCGGAGVVIRAGGGIAAILLLSAIVLVVQLCAAWVIWVAAAHHVIVRLPSAGDCCRTLRRALPFATAGLVANLQARLNPLMLGALAGPADLAAYGVAVRLESVVRRLPYAAFGAALPVFASAGNRSPEVRARFEWWLRWFAIVAAVGLAVGAVPLVRFTYGAAFAGASVPLMWAGAALVPSLLNSSRRVYLNATGRERFALACSAAALAIHAAGGVALIARFGATGAVWAFALGELATWAPLRAAAAGRGRRTPIAVTTRADALPPATSLPA